VRWEELFGDLEAQAEQLAAAELQAEVADRTRREVARLGLVDRLREATEQTLVVTVWGAGAVHGRLLDVGVDWLLLQEVGLREVLVPLDAVLGITGIGPRSAAPGTEGEVARRLELRWALRGLARDRAGVSVVLKDASTLSGTLDRVGADHVDVAEHAPGEARRAGAVRQVRVVPVTALALLRST
jgi:hypothetical protein